MTTRARANHAPAGTTTKDRGSAIHTEGLTKRFGSATAVDDVSLDVERGEVYGFVGLNGAGKTTVMRMLVGLAAPTSGSFSLLGRPRLTNDVLRRVGATIEGPAFFPRMTGRANLRMLARYWGFTDDDVASALDTVDLAGRADDRYRTYSMGMRQRLALAAALLGRPELLVLDEPANGLDPSGMASMRDVIRAQADRGCTVMLSSHLLGEISQVCDRVGVLHEGRLMAVGTPAEIEHRYGSAPGLVVRCDDLGLAAGVARGLDGVTDVREEGGALVVTVPEDRAGALTTALVGAGVTVHGMQPHRRGLEEVFLEMTRGGEVTDAHDAEAVAARPHEGGRS